MPGDEAPQVFESAVGYQPLLEDLNGDGLIDAYVANIHYIQNANPGELHQAADAPFDQLLLATGIVDGIPQYRDETGRIVQTHDFNKSWHASAGDLDNDGDLDVLVPNLSFGSDRYRSPEVRLLINDGSGAMAPLAELNFPPMIVSPTQILPFDSDLDGDLDLFLANGFTTPILLVNRLFGDA